MPPNATRRFLPWRMIRGSVAMLAQFLTTVEIGDPTCPLSLTIRVRMDPLPSDHTTWTPPVGNRMAFGSLMLLSAPVFEIWIHLLFAAWAAGVECGLAAPTSAAAPAIALCVGTASATLVRRTQGTSNRRRVIDQTFRGRQTGRDEAGDLGVGSQYWPTGDLGTSCTWAVGAGPLRSGRRRSSRAQRDVHG